MRIAFLCSGGGGNLRFIAQAIRRGWLPRAGLCAVWSDRQCPAHDFAVAQGIPSEVVDFAPQAQVELLARLRALAPDVVVTTVHRLLIPEWVDAFAGRLVNLHYSLLPAFAGAVGAGPVEQALSHGVKLLGVTVHHVDARLDMGRPILQAVTPTPDEPRPDAVMTVLFRAGCIALMNVLAGYTAGARPGPLQEFATLGGCRVWFSTSVALDSSLEQELGWDFLDA